MAEETFKLEIITPIGKALDSEVASVTLPSKQGEIGVLPRHVKYCGLVGTGVLEYLEVGATSGNRLVVSGGFANFTDDGLSILADSVDTLDSVDRERYADEREEITAFLKDKDTNDAEWQYAAERLARIEAIDRLISH